MRRLALVLLLVWSVCCACGDGQPDSGDVGAGVDSGTDVGRDAGRDASPDAAARDSGGDTAETIDAATDGGPDDPGWRPIPGLPSECVVERADEPSRVAPTLTLDSCAGLASGCDRYRISALDRVPVAASRSDAGELVLVTMSDAGTRQEVLLWIEARPVAAWRSGRAVIDGSLCSLGPMAVSEAVFGLAIRYGSTSRSVNLHHGSIRDPAATDVPRTILGEAALGGATIAEMRVTDLALGGDLQPGGVPYVIDSAVFVLRDLTPTAPPAGDIGGPVSLVGDRLFWSNWGSVIDVLTGSPTSGPAVLIPGVDNPRIRNFLASETELAWYLGYDYDELRLRFARLELWTSPFATDAASVVPRRVLELPSPEHTEFVLGEGLVVRRPLSGREIEIIDLVDGRMRHLALPTGWVATETLFVATDLLVFAAGSAADGAFVLRLDPREIPYD